MKQFFLYTFILSSLYSFSQSPDKIINEQDVLRIEKQLASDELMGRKPGTPGIEKAAAFIEKEFSQAGLAFLPGLNSYRQEFGVFRAKVTSANIQLDGQAFDSKKMISLSYDDEINFDEISQFEKVRIPADSNLMALAEKLVAAKKHYVVFVDTAHSANFRRLNRVSRDQFSKNPSVIFVLSATVPSKYNFEIKQEVQEVKMTNIVGMLPGVSKAEEMVIFSGHYDHIGVGKPNAAGDSIFNGANDDAAGVTALIMLSKYFSKYHNNERSLIFSAFTAEELGGFGSKYFSLQLDPGKVVAMFNIEMIGTESKWGTNSAYITGFEKSDMAKILQKNLEGTKFTFHPDPYPDQKLFYRSDNATLAELGVPAHTISTSKMDAEPYYHSPDDEIETLDLQNMTEIIKAIAISSKTIVSGLDTPSRVETNLLKK